MKKPTWNLVAVTLIATLTATIAQSKFSGIYEGNVSSGARFMVALTKGGRAVGLDSSIEGIKGVLSPAKSTINADGKFKGVAPNGTTVVATVSSDFKIKGTAKNEGETFRLSGSRTYN